MLGLGFRLGLGLEVDHNPNACAAEPIAASYFPLTSAAAIRGRAKQLMLLVDRAVGAASLADGQLEVMAVRVSG